MKRFIFLFLMGICIANFTFAQQDTTTIFQRPRGYYVDPIRSKWKMKVAQVDDLWVVSLYGKRNALQEQISFEDKDLTIRKGPYVLYDQGHIKQEGNYERGYKVDEWKVYYPNKVLKEKSYYTWGKWNGVVRNYWANGKLKAIRRYTLDKPTGDWKFFYEDGKLALAETYAEDGKLIVGTYFDTAGKGIDKMKLNFNLEN